MGILLAEGAIHGVAQSARGQAHSKTLAHLPMRQTTRSVLECASPLALFPAKAFNGRNARTLGPTAYSPRYTHFAVQVSATTTSVSSGSFGFSLFQIQAAMFSLVGFSRPGTSFR